jgi:hypothetical protein
MAALTPTPVLPEAILVGPLSAHLRRSRPTALDPKHAFKIGLLDGREGQESGLWLKALVARGAVVQRCDAERVNPDPKQ